MSATPSVKTTPTTPTTLPVIKTAKPIAKPIAKSMVKKTAKPTAKPTAKIAKKAAKPTAKPNGKLASSGREGSALDYVRTRITKVPQRIDALVAAAIKACKASMKGKTPEQTIIAKLYLMRKAGLVKIDGDRGEKKISLA